MDYQRLLVSALVGALAGGVGVGLGALLRLPLRGRQALTVGALVTGLLASGALVPHKSERERMVEQLQEEAARGGHRTPLERLGGLVAGEMAQRAELVDWLLAHRHHSPAEREAASTRQTAEGLTRLDDGLLGERARILDALLAKTSLATCAALGRGTLTRPQLEELFGAAGEDDLRAWARLSVEAMAVRTREVPARTPTQEETRVAFEALFRRLPPEEVRRMADVGARIAQASDDEVCWFTRTLYRQALEAEGASRSTLLVTLAQ